MIQVKNPLASRACGLATGPLRSLAQTTRQGREGTQDPAREYTVIWILMEALAVCSSQNVYESSMRVYTSSTQVLRKVYYRVYWRNPFAQKTCYTSMYTNIQESIHIHKKCRHLTASPGWARPSAIPWILVVSLCLMECV